MSAVELRGVSKLYGDVRAVDSVDLKIESGEFVTLLGPSGCGKTTTLRIVAGFVRPNAGTVVVGGADITMTPPHRRQVGLVFQNYALFPHMTVGENVEFGLKMRKVDPSERRTRVAEALDLVRLGGYEARYPNQLSGGQQQRVALARALVVRPDVLLLDEPFGALDKQLRDHMRVELRVLQQKLAISTIFVTHDQEEAMAMSDRICVMESGVMRQIGTPSDIYERPCNRFVADFMGRSNLLDARIEGADGEDVIVDAGGVRLRAVRPVSAMDEVLVMIRPERILLSRPDDGDGVLRGRIASAIYLGSLMHYEVAMSNGASIQVTSQIDSDFARQHFSAGEEVSVVVPREAVYILEQR
jgi:spermidine/putrescine ABC transporter ATP-binding subunit